MAEGVMAEGSWRRWSWWGRTLRRWAWRWTFRRRSWRRTLCRWSWWGRTLGGGHGGGHYAGGHGGGGHFGGGHGGGHYAGGHGGGGHFGGGGGRSGNGRNAFGTERMESVCGERRWRLGRLGRRLGRLGGWVGPVFWPFLLGTSSHTRYGRMTTITHSGLRHGVRLRLRTLVPAHSNYGYSDLSNVYGYTGTTGDSRNDTHVNQISPEVTQSCGGFAPGVTSFPIDRIRQAIDPTGEQVTFLDDLATASSKASALLYASCPNQPPLTPLARLDAVERRLDATIRAIESVRPALATLYNSRTTNRGSASMRLEPRT